ncbi:MAG: hypothetical protein IID40_11280, partial [Planctomycetes bacterium]|nr:hypothetical protein [Planctomycetota bacterium]
MTGWSTLGGCLLASAADRVSIERRIEFEALPGGWARVAGLAVAGLTIWAVVWMYRREGRAGSSLRVRMGLAVVRSVVLLVLMAIYLEPVLATYVTRWIESYTLVVVDDSASMDLRDLYRDPERAERVGRVLGHAPSEPVRRIDLVNRVLWGPEHRLAEALTRRNGVKVYAFGEVLEPVATLVARRAGGDSGRGVADGSTGYKPVAHSKRASGDGGDLFSFSARRSA